MDKDFVPEKYGMAICPLCNGKGFLNKRSGPIDIFVRSVCIKCGGFGAIRKEKEVLESGELDPTERKRWSWGGRSGLSMEAFKR